MTIFTACHANGTKLDTACLRQGLSSEIGREVRFSSFDQKMFAAAAPFVQWYFFDTKMFHAGNNRPTTGIVTKQHQNSVDTPAPQ